MALGLCGAQRTGKTTLAKAYADKVGIPFVKTTTAQVFAKYGLSPKADLPLHVRLAHQELIMHELVSQWRRAQSEHDGMFVSDRTPIDMATYMMADITRGAVLGGAKDPVETGNRVLGYVDKCLELTHELFSVVVLVQPGIPLVDAEGSAPTEPAYIEHFNLIARGILAGKNIDFRRYVMPREMLDLNRRVDALQKCMVDSVSAYKARLDSITIH